MKSPDPERQAHSSRGVTRTLDDWATMFHLCLVVLPPRPEAAMILPIARRIFAVFGDADCRTAYCVVGNEFIAKGVLGDAEHEALTFCDPDGELREEPRPHARYPRSCTCARTRRSSRAPRAGTRSSGSAWPRRSPRRWTGRTPRSRGPGDPPPTPGLAGLTAVVLTSLTSGNTPRVVLPV